MKNDCLNKSPFLKKSGITRGCLKPSDLKQACSTCDKLAYRLNMLGQD